MIQAQAEGEFNTEYRESDEPVLNLPEEKAQSLSMTPRCVSDAEADDYAEEGDADTLDYDAMGVASKGGQWMDYSLEDKSLQLEYYEAELLRYQDVHRELGGVELVQAYADENFDFEDELVQALPAILEAAFLAGIVDEV